MSAAKREPSEPVGLSPHPGSNPERFPVPADRLLEFFQEQRVQCPELCYITSRAVGHTVSVYSVGSSDPRFKEAARAVSGFNGTAYQVMRWDEGPGPGKEFWGHQLWERPQWYSTPEQACAAYVASYLEWIKDHPEAVLS